MNKLKNNLCIIFILLFLFVGEIYSSEFDGDHSWMLLPTSSRGASLAQSVVAVIDNDITSFSNPGGVVFLNDKGFSYSYCLPYQYYFGITNSKSHIFSINKNITNRIKTGFTFQYYNSGLSGSSKRYSIGILYSQKIDNIGIGIKTKLNSFEYYMNNPSFAFDLGFSYVKNVDYGNRIKVKNISFGTSLLNISYTLKYRPRDIIRTYGLPYVFRIGYSMTLKSQINRKGKYVYSLVHTLEYMDVLNTRYIRYRKDIGTGLEFNLYEMLFLRLGYRTKGYISSPRNGLTYGAGLKINLNYFFENISLVYNYAQYPWSPSPGSEIQNFKIHSLNFQYNL